MTFRDPRVWFRGLLIFAAAVTAAALALEVPL